MDRIKYLILQLLREEITAAEQAELEAWAAAAPENRALLAELQDVTQVAEGLAKLDRLHRQEAWGRVEEHAAAVRAAKGMEAEDSLLREQGSRRIPWIRRTAVAAAVVALLGTGYWWIGQKGKPISAPTVAVATDVAAPARSRATL